MQYMNNDMDELFRRAAEGYPLDTGKGDWNKVASALENGEEKQVKKDDRRRYLWLLLLLPLGLVCNQYFRTGKMAGTEKTVTQLDQPISGARVNKSSDTKTGDINSRSSETIDKKGPNDNSQPSFMNESARSTSRYTGMADGVQSLFTTPAIAARSQRSSGDFAHLITAQETANTNLEHPGNEEDQMGVANRLSVRNLAPIRSSVTIQLKDHAERTNLAGENTPIPLAPSARKSKFYAGVMGGVDVTTVKFQKVENAGYDYGLLLGYSFASKWGVELGAFMDKKFYYSDGKYFKNSKVYLPPNSSITDVYGNCRMIDIPLSLRYELSSTRKTSWFATAGISSYVMKKEKYSYVYYYGTTGVYATHDKTYNNASRNLFSVLQFSTGYTHRLGRVGNLRIEPYVKLPLTGLGYGSLPLLSGGLHVGLTR